MGAVWLPTRLEVLLSGTRIRSRVCPGVPLAAGAATAGAGADVAAGIAADTAIGGAADGGSEILADASGDELAGGNGFRGIGDNTDDESFEYHYAKHANGVSRQQYAKDAQDFARNPTGKQTDVTLRDGSRGVKYRTPGAPGGIFEQDGNAISFWYK